MLHKQRNERIKKAIEEYTKIHTSSKELARKSLVRSGICYANGKLRPEFGGKTREPSRNSDLRIEAVLKAMTMEGQTVKEIAVLSNNKPATVNAILGELSQQGFVRSYYDMSQLKTKGTGTFWCLND